MGRSATRFKIVPILSWQSSNSTPYKGLCHVFHEEPFTDSAASLSSAVLSFIARATLMH